MVEVVTENVKDIGEQYGKGLIVVDCSATWCRPCKVISPKFDELSNKPDFNEVTFLKMDVDNCEALATKLEVEAMPTFLYFKGGKIVKDSTVVGANIDDVESALRALL
eukprot:GHVH01001246.1.p2 GENE.GHVH01001246.1~~GHVH01001246.1.p2  ORF type:complete len:108 (+),score=23.53 GHVH01001246.1:547-870(+)